VINTLKKNWILILISLILLNIIGLYLAGGSIGISDALEHAETDKVIANLKQKEYFYTLFIELVFILDGWLILFVPYLLISNFVKKFNVSKK
jgi:hypothetical protein